MVDLTGKKQILKLWNALCVAVKNNPTILKVVFQLHRNVLSICILTSKDVMSQNSSLTSL